MKIDIIGDIHGCLDEFVLLTKQLGYDWSEGIPLHPEGRVLGFVGDLTDRGSDSLQVIDVIHRLWEKELAYYSPGNHCNKLYRWFIGNKVQINNGLETTIAELDQLSTREFKKIRNKFVTLYEQSPLYHVLDSGKLVIAHAGILEKDIGKMNAKIKTFVLYGDITGAKHADGSPVRLDWAKHYQGEALIIYGHTPVKNVRHVNRTANIDTGCVFGGGLTAFRYPEEETVTIPSSMPYVPEKFRSFNETQ